MSKESKDLKDLKKQKKECYIEFYYLIISVLFFPIFGIIMSIMWLCDTISNIHKINKEIKKQKIKDILSDIIIIKDENGFVKDIKL